METAFAVFFGCGLFFPLFGLILIGIGDHLHTKDVVGIRRREYILSTPVERLAKDVLDGHDLNTFIPSSIPSLPHPDMDFVGGISGEEFARRMRFVTLSGSIEAVPKRPEPTTIPSAGRPYRS